MPHRRSRSTSCSSASTPGWSWPFRSCPGRHHVVLEHRAIRKACTIGSSCSSTEIVATTGRADRPTVLAEHVLDGPVLEGQAGIFALQSGIFLLQLLEPSELGHREPGLGLAENGIMNNLGRTMGEPQPRASATAEHLAYRFAHLV